MKKHYSILWIDDEEDSVRTPIRIITQHLKEKGVVANIVFSNPTVWSSGYNSDEKVVNCLADPELDMVLMDYNLGDSHGKDVIVQLREEDIFVPVIYYSQQHFGALKESLTQDNVDGVFVTHRDNLEDRTKKILDSLLKKEHRVRRMRGLLLSDTSELEARGANIAEKCWSFLNEGQKEIVRNRFKEYVCKSLKGNTSQIKNFNYAFDSVIEIWEARIFDASKRGYLLQKICEQLGWEEHSSNIKNLCGKVQPIHIFSKRNEFAHQTEEKLQASIDAIPNSDFPKELREELHNAENNMQKLLSAIEAKERG